MAKGKRLPHRVAFPRRPNDQSFRRNDLQRMIRGAENEGLKNYQIKIRPHEMTLIKGAPEAAPAEATITETELKDLV